jgi:N-acetylneuraminic acid mutarotase
MADHWTLDLANGGGWKTAAPLIDPRNHLAGAALDGKIYAIGGQHLWNEDSPLAEVDAYDPKTDRWTKVASLPQPRSHISSAALVVDGRIVVIGGATTDFNSVSAIANYNPAANQWRTQTPLPGPLITPISGYINSELVVATGSVTDLVATGNVYVGSPA